MLLIQTVVETDFSHVPSSLLSELCCTWPFAALSTIKGRGRPAPRSAQASCCLNGLNAALPAHQKCLPFPPLPLTIRTYALVAGVFTLLVWFLLPVVLILLTHPMRESVFFKRKMKEAGAGLMRKNVQSVQIPALCKGKAAKSRFAQALCLSNIFGVGNRIVQARFCI